MAVPSKALGNVFWTGEVPIGAIEAEDRRGVETQRLILLGMALLALWLARRVARQFLEPAFLLSRATLEVARGNFSVRMPESLRNEFGRLARSFNRMATEAQEGRLLGRFVSEAVLTAARDQTREEQARKGEMREAIVLFANLIGFKELLKKSEPGPLIQELNLALKAMSRIIREEGGEIDKFIGDKILAYFPLPSPSSVEGLSQAAIRSARRIQIALNPLSRRLPVQVGVGITMGPVLSGIMGAPEVRLEMTIIGDTVNLASRLADLAGKEPAGGIVVDGAMAEVLEQSTNAGGLERMAISSVKGKSREVEIYLCR